MIAAALLSAPPAPLSSSSSLSKPPSTTTTTTALKKGEQQVRTLIPVTTADGSKLFVSGPCILLKAAPKPPAPTVAQQMQALRPLLKADNNSIKDAVTKTSNSNNVAKLATAAIKTTADKAANVSTTTKTTSTTTKLSSSLSPGSNTENEPHEALRCKRRIDFSSLGLPKPQPQAMARRNERERNRVKQVNLGFETLRQHVPQGRKNKKLSKVDTLKEACKYIKYLHDLLLDADQKEGAEDEKDGSLLTSISDTINIVSRPSVSTTAKNTENANTEGTRVNAATVTSPISPVATKTSSSSSLVSTSTNTAAITSEDLMQLAGNHYHASAPEDNTHMMDFVPSDSTLAFRETVESSGSYVFNNNVSGNGQTASNLTDFAQQMEFDDISQPEPVVTNMDNTGAQQNSPVHLLELGPAHLNFLDSQPQSAPPRTVSTTTTATDMNIDHVQSTLNPATTLVNQLVECYTNTPTFSSANRLSPHPTSTSSNFLDYNHLTSTSSSPVESSPPMDGGVPPETYHQYHHHHQGSSRQFSAPGYDSHGMTCGGGSDGSCPVSPCESSEASDMSHEERESLGVSGGETWQDLTAVAEWLCSKFDIDSPDVFV